MSNRDEIRARLESQLCHELGEAILDALELPGVSDVHVDSDGALHTRQRGRWTTDENVRYSPEQRETVIGLVAHSLHLEATSRNPVIEGEMEFGGQRFRFTGHLPPMVSGPTIYIRKPAAIIYTLAQYEDDRIITARQRALLQQAVETRRNILIAGGMGSGKSTLANALIGAISPEMHVGIIEDTYELACNLPHRSHLHTTENIDMRTLVRTAKRCQLDRVIVGEVRGAEALELLKIWNAGAPGGITTIHADDAAAALLSLGSYVQEAGVPPQPQLIARAINLVVFIQLERGQRHVTEILELKGLNADGEFNFKPAA